MVKQAEKIEKTTEVKPSNTDKSRKSDSRDQVIFTVSYNATTRCVKIGNFSIPSWLLCVFAGALSVLILQAIFCK